MMRDCQHTIQLTFDLCNLCKSLTASTLLPAPNFVGQVSYKQPYTAHSGYCWSVPL